MGYPSGLPPQYVALCICLSVCVCVCYPNLFWSQLSHFKSDLNGIKSKVFLLSYYNSTSQKARSDWGVNCPGNNCPRRQLTIISDLMSDSNGIKCKFCLPSWYNSSSQKDRSICVDNYPVDNCPSRQLTTTSHF